jgi:hypothetical protein
VTEVTERTRIYKPTSERGLKGVVCFWRACYKLDKERRDWLNGNISGRRLTEAELDLAIFLGSKP